MSQTQSERNYWQDFVLYASRMGQFDGLDWRVYFVWIGMMLCLFGSIVGFLTIGASRGVVYPSYVWNVPAGTFIFILAIAFDTIGHRTIYKKALQQGEALVHHITIVAGVSSCLLLCLAFTYPVGLRIPAIVMTALTVFYSMIDEAMHWFRYFAGNSDRIEMWSHFFIFVGHTIMMLAWLLWFENGYPGVAETLAVWPKLF